MEVCARPGTGSLTARAHFTVCLQIKYNLLIDFWNTLWYNINVVKRKLKPTPREWLYGTETSSKHYQFDRMKERATDSTPLKQKVLIQEKVANFSEK